MFWNDFDMMLAFCWRYVLEETAGREGKGNGNHNGRERVLVDTYYSNVTDMALSKLFATDMALFKCLQRFGNRD